MDGQHLSNHIFHCMTKKHLISDTQSVGVRENCLSFRLIIRHFVIFSYSVYFIIKDRCVSRACKSNNEKILQVGNFYNEEIECSNYLEYTLWIVIEK